MTSDPFATEELRRRVIAAWRDSPARFRADANVEEDLALVGYRDRVVVELAQNAADAATRAEVAGQVVFELRGATLTVTNNGAPLDAAGVESIAVARASAKRDLEGMVGRFGVGFAAVRAVTEEPRIVSSTGGVQWSRARAWAELAAVPELAGELEMRGERIPVLRLPYAVPAAVADRTTVTLPLADAAAVAAVRHQLEALDAALLFALPALVEIVVRIDGDERRLTVEHDDDRVIIHDGDTTSRWTVLTAAGLIPAELLADRPAEERSSDGWQVTWALPINRDGRLTALPPGIARVVRAPTAVDDPLTLPAVLIATYPLDATRRRVTTGVLADLVTTHAADALIATLARLPADPALLRLVPMGFPDGEVDGALHAAVIDRLHDSEWLPVAADPLARQRPREAVVVDDPLVAPLSRVVPQLLPAGWSQPELAALGVRRPDLAEILEELHAVDEPPGWWRAVYAALDEAVLPGPERDALGALPVPLADGTVVTGPRGAALPSAELPDVDVAAIGVRLVHADAAHPLLRALGAVDGTPRGLLALSGVRDVVEGSLDLEDPEPVAVAVLTLVAACGVDVDEVPWLVDLALPDESGGWRPAGELLLPGGRLADLVAPDSGFGRVAPDWLLRWESKTLAAVGALDGPAMLREPDPAGPVHDLDDEPAWWATLPADGTLDELVAVRDLEQIRDEALPDLLAIVADPPWRAAVVEPAIVELPDGTRRELQSYTAWWLSSRPVLGGRVPRNLRLIDADLALAGLFDPVPDGYDVELLRALGVHDCLDDADPDDLLARMADPQRIVSREQLRTLYAWLSERPVGLPRRLRALRDGRVAVVNAEEVIVVDQPDLLPLTGSASVLPVSLSRAPALAGRLDIPLASELAAFEVRSSGERIDDAVVHRRLIVTDVDGVERGVAWRFVNGTLHVDASQREVGLGRGRAWRDGVWSARHRRTEGLTDLTTLAVREAEDDLDEDEG
ncbi:MAG TPA: hypothetical protein VMH41_08195 [Mycobacteriales bacterium]|nr:hypothetical protein [Mycobacteriales bacterium]